MKTRIGELCNKPKDTPEAKTCLDFLQLYAELSILRQLILADIASLLSEPEVNLVGTGNNFLKIVKEKQISDKDLFAPFADPLNYPRNRRTISYLFGTPHNYEVLYSYMTTLHNNVQGGIFKDMVVVCNDRLLGDYCVPMDQSEYPKLSELSLDKVIASAYIPKGKKLTAWDQDNFNGHEYGPFVGRIVHGLVGGFDKWKSLKVEATNDDIDNQARFCEKEDMDPYELCDSIKPHDGPEYFPILQEMRNHHGTNWEKKTIKSLYVPKGLFLAGSQFQGGQSFGQVYGPQLVSKVCYSGRKNADALICKTTEGIKSFDGSPKDARKMVQFCDQEDLQGFCIRDDKSKSSLAVVSQ